MTRKKPRQLPITLVTGYLGSGKTTLVNRLLADCVTSPGGPRVAVLVNEFGAVGVDGALLADQAAAAGPGQVIELANGCLCCVVAGEFREALEALPVDRLDQVIVETSGAADPTTVIKLFWGAPELTERFRLDGVVCVVDSVNFDKNAAADPVVSVQAAVADELVLSKVERAGVAAVSGLRARLGEMNPSARFHERELTSAEPLGLGGLLKIDAYRKPQPLFRRDLASNSKTASHGALTSVAVSWEGRVDRAEMQSFFRELVKDTGVVRTKALLHVEGEDHFWLIQGVQEWIERTPAPRSYKGPNRLVVLGRSLDAARLHEAIGRLRS